MALGHHSIKNEDQLLPGRHGLVVTVALMLPHTTVHYFSGKEREVVDILPVGLQGLYF